jgi:hypothetical protein
MTRKSETAPKSAPAATAKKAAAASRRGVAAAAEAEAPKTPRTASPKTESASTKRPAAPLMAESAPKARRKASPKPPAPALAPLDHPHTVANLAEVDEIDRVPDQPFAEGVQDGLDADLRQRMISERAYRLYCERGGSEGYDVDDWLQAEAEVDHLLLNPASK